MKVNNDTTRNLIIISFILLLTSCEGYFRFRGEVLDDMTKQPLSGVKVLLILNAKDTMKMDGKEREYDTISYEKRLALRKKGIKDDYTDHDRDVFYKIILKSTDITDSVGSFNVHTPLLNFSLNLPTCKLVFIKAGFKKLSLQTKETKNDSMNISLEKERELNSP